MCGDRIHRKIGLCSSTKLAREADGSRSSRRVDDVKVEKELMGCQIWAMYGSDDGLGGYDGVDGVDGVDGTREH